jgi:hypothetical protein
MNQDLKEYAWLAEYRPTEIEDISGCYSAEDQWYFDIPLAIRLRKPLRLRHRWLINARILVNKSEQCVLIGQTTMNQYYPHLPSKRTVMNASLEQIGSASQYVQVTILNLWSSRTLGPS